MTQRQTEDLRSAVLEYLAQRQQLSFDPVQVHRGLSLNRMLDFQVGGDDVAMAVLFLHGKGWITLTASDVGATKYARATSDGVLASERSRAERDGVL